MVKNIFRDKDQILSGGCKKKGVWGSMGEKPKMCVIFAKFLLFSKIQTLSHKLLVRQTSNHHHCDGGTFKGFEHFFLSKTNLLTSVHNDADDANDAHNTDDYSRMIGIAQLKAFSCANKMVWSMLFYPEHKFNNPREIRSHLVSRNNGISNKSTKALPALRCTAVEGNDQEGDPKGHKGYKTNCLEAYTFNSFKSGIAEERARKVMDSWI